MKICVSGGTGQIGSYVLEKALELGHQVYGLKRRVSSYNTSRIDHIFNNPNLTLVYGDLTDYASLSNFIRDIQPDAFINCGAQSHVGISFSNPLATQSATGDSVLYCLEAIRQYSPKTRFVTMSSSEMFGSTLAPQSETSPFHPRSVYACAKLFGYNTTVHYREMGFFASNAICFNTESPRRGENFFPKKVCRAAARIKMGLQKELVVGNLLSYRSFNHAKDVVEGLLLIANADEPDDYVVGNNPMIKMQDFVKIVFSKLELNWEDYVKIDPKYFRKTEVDQLEPDSTKLKTKLGWQPKYSLDNIIDEMLEYDLSEAEKELKLRDDK